MRQLLIKYLENKCTPLELDQVLAYLQTERGQKHLEEIIDQEINNEAFGVSVDADYDRIFEHIKKNIKPEISQRRSGSFSIHKKWYAVAATVSGFLLLATILFLVLRTDSTVYQTAYGETKSILLPDGSSVMLNANSSMSVKNNFDKQREVWLEGEAFFEVEKTKADNEYVKFVVHTNRLQVEVLGTSFNVQNWKEKTQVVLKSGKVKLKSGDDEVLTMKPGELAEVLAENSSIQKKVVNPEIYSSWTENRLLCNDTPLAQIGEVIQRRFGKQVLFEDDELKTLLVTGTLPLNELSLLTEILKESLNINIDANDSTLMISKYK